MRAVFLQSSFAALAGADADGILDRHDENFAVAEAVGGSGRADFVHQRIDHSIGYDRVYAQFGGQVFGLECRNRGNVLDVNLPLAAAAALDVGCLLYTSPSPRDTR